MIGDGLQEDFVGAIRAVGFDAEFLGVFDQRGEVRILRCKGVHCEAQIERRQAKFLGHDAAPDWVTVEKINSSVGRGSVEKVLSSR